MDGLLQKNYRQESVTLPCHPGALKVTTYPAPLIAGGRLGRSGAIRGAAHRALAARALSFSDHPCYIQGRGPGLVSWLTADIEKVLGLAAQGPADLGMILYQEEE
jgi:hypothetical protein